MTAITLNLDDEDIEKIDRFRKERGVTNKFIFNTALERFLKKRGFSEE